MAEATAPGDRPVRRRRINLYAYACAFLASMTSVLLGYDIGVMSGAIIFIKKDLKITDVQVEIIAGILNVFSLVGALAAGRTSDWIGRRYTIVLAGAIFFVGAVVMGLAPSYAWLMVGRFVAGVGVGYALMIAPVYTAELAPASTRGFLTSFPEVFINAGILFGYVSNYAFAKLPLRVGWRLMLGVGALPSVLISLGVLAMPESPRWLVMQGRLDDAKRVLERTSDTPEEAEVRLADIKAVAGVVEEGGVVVSVPKKHHGEGVWMELFIRPAPHVRRILLAAVGIHFFQQASGIDSVVLYSPRVFDKAGFSKSASLLATVAVGFTKTTFILVATFTLDRFGRRPLLLTSFAGMILTLCGLGWSLTVIGNHHSGHVEWAIGLAVASILGYVATFSIGAGPITWVYTSEIFPLRLRAQGASIGVVVNRVTSGAISMSFLSLTKAVTIGGAFFIYAGVAVAAWVFFCSYLPETKGKTLEQAEKLFRGKEEAAAAAAGEVELEEHGKGGA
ncbi:Polyol transporter 5 [Nymphaea thermarum]|nr:Polyol transporter 5 [Nymphaea thermarum]